MLSAVKDVVQSANGIDNAKRGLVTTTKQTIENEACSGEMINNLAFRQNKVFLILFQQVAVLGVK